MEREREKRRDGERMSKRWIEGEKEVVEKNGLGDIERKRMNKGMERRG